MKENDSKKWIIGGIVLFLGLAGLFLTGRFCLNELFLGEYRAGTFRETFERPLLPLNIPEGWLPLYHMGNISYLHEEYDEAVSWYQQSLEKNPPAEEKECAVRINLALALLHKIDYTQLDSEETAGIAVRQLQAARNVLTEHGCADPDGTDGHSPEAEQLKKEIDELLQQLQNSDSQSDQEKQEQQEQEKQEQQEQEDKQESNREKRIREQLEQQKEKSAKERAEAENQRTRQEDGSGGGNFDGKTW